MKLDFNTITIYAKYLNRRLRKIEECMRLKQFMDKCFTDKTGLKIEEINLYARDEFGSEVLIRLYDGKDDAFVEINPHLPGLAVRHISNN